MSEKWATTPWREPNANEVMLVKSAPRARCFPCPYCKGEGGWTEYVDAWYGPHCDCQVCSGKGMIEVGSEDHAQLRFNRAHIATIDAIFPAGGKEGEGIPNLPEEFWNELHDELKGLIAKYRQRAGESA